MIFLHDVQYEKNKSSKKKLNYKWKNSYRVIEIITNKNIYFLNELNNANLQNTFVDNCLKKFHVRIDQFLFSFLFDSFDAEKNMSSDVEKIFRVDFSVSNHEKLIFFEWSLTVIVPSSLRNSWRRRVVVFFFIFGLLIDVDCCFVWFFFVFSCYPFFRRMFWEFWKIKKSKKFFLSKQIVNLIIYSVYKKWKFNFLFDLLNFLCHFSKCVWNFHAISYFFSCVIFRQHVFSKKNFSFSLIFYEKKFENETKYYFSAFYNFDYSFDFLICFVHFCEKWKTCPSSLRIVWLSSFCFLWRKCCCQRIKQLHFRDFIQSVTKKLYSFEMLKQIENPTFFCEKKISASKSRFIDQPDEW